MIASGLGSGLVAAILLAKAHKKSEATFEDIFEQVDAVRDAVEENNTLIEFAEEDGQDLPEGAYIIDKTTETKMLMPFYLQFVKEAAILYGPSILLGLFSIGMIVGSHGILKRRNQALFSTMVLLERGFSAYRERVRNELGEDSDNRFLYGLESRNETVITTDKDGKKKKKKVKKDVLSETYSPEMFQRWFDSTNKNHQNDERQNYFWLGVAQGMMNDKLEAKGYVMLNDVYRALGIEETGEGQLLGWSLAAPGDNFIDFGVDRPWNNPPRPDGRILLDFNFNGPVHEYIGIKTPFSSFNS
jgi:hypothetical protein